MPVIPVNVTRVPLLVAGEPVAAMPDGRAVSATLRAERQRSTQKPLRNRDLTIIADDRAETVQFSLPEGGLPKGPGERAMIPPEDIAAVTLGENGPSGEVAPAMWGHSSPARLRGLKA